MRFKVGQRVRFTDAIHYLAPELVGTEGTVVGYIESYSAPWEVIPDAWSPATATFFSRELEEA